MTALPDTGPASLGDWALHYARRGFEIIPVSHLNKAPLTTNGFKDATADQDVIAGWWDTHPHALIGCRIPVDVVVLDIDPRHGGHDTWAALEAAHGPVPRGREHRSGRGDDGAHRWFRRPDVELSTKPLNEWARQHGTGHATGARSWTAGIDILHHDQRYTILPPSPHPETGKPYSWTSKADPAVMPSWLVELLTKPATPAVAARTTLRVADENSIADWFSAHTTWNDILGPAGWVLVDGDGDADGSKWRHPNATADTSCSIKHGCLFVYSPNTDFDVTGDSGTVGYTRFRAWATLEHGGDLKHAARAARIAKDGATPGTPAVTVWSPPPAVDPETGEIVRRGAYPDEFWAARPVLTHIRQAALSRMVAPAAVLGCVLARVAAFTPPSTCLPPIIGTVAPLSTYIALCARSGGGKTSSTGCADDLLPTVPAGCIGPLPLGSGEGLIDAYFEMVDTDQDGKKVRTKRHTRHGALFSLDEGQALAEIGNRKGATILPILRSAWSGGHAGQANASIETKRILRSGSYSVGLISLWQWAKASLLIDDHEGGTPQRFVFIDTADPTVSADRPAWPGPLDWQPPAMIAIGGVLTSSPMDVDQRIQQEIVDAHIAVVRGEVEIDPLDAHRRLAKLKIAGLLAVLEHRRDIGLDDWELAEMVMAHSDHCRSWIVAENRRKAAEAEAARTRTMVDRDAAIEQSAVARALTQGAKAAHRVVRQANGTPVPRREIHHALASRVRRLVSADEVISEAVKLRWITPVEGAEGWVIGDAAPR